MIWITLVHEMYQRGRELDHTDTRIVSNYTPFQALYVYVLFRTEQFVTLNNQKIGDTNQVLYVKSIR